LNILHDRGFLIIASNTDYTDYLSCAEQLADSLKYWHPEIPICLLTDQLIENKKFDLVRAFPNGDTGQNSQWKLSNDWQAGVASPFRRTIKLEADMLLTSSISHWWHLFDKRDLVISTGARNFYGQSADSRFYRRVFDENHLPDVYNAITYWRLSKLSQDFFRLIRNIFENWEVFRTWLKFSDDLPTTDLIYAMAAHIIGPESVTLPDIDFIKIVHMKKHIIPCHGSNWTRELVWEFDHNQLRINTIAQNGFFHYQTKNWAKHIERFK